MKNLSTEQIREVFRAYTTGFGHTVGKPLETACFTLYTGRDHDLYPYIEVRQMVEELALVISQGQPLSACQKSVFQQLKSNGVLEAFKTLSQMGEEAGK